MEVNIIPKFLDSALTPVAKEAGERLADIVSLVFTPVIKAKAKRDKNIELFLKELEKKVDKIPEENLQNPPLSLVGPIIDNVFKFYHDEPHLRAMYSNLIASSMNNKVEVHPSYIEIIRQLSPIDASVFSTHLNIISNKEDTDVVDMIDESCYLTFRISEILLNNPGVPYPLFYLKEDKAYRINESVIDSLQNLLRLGLIYSDEYKIPIEYLQKYNIRVIRKSDNLFASLYSICLTNFGINFALSCCEKINRSNFFKENVNGILSSIICDKSSFEYSCK